MLFFLETFQDQFRTWQKDFTLNVEEESKLCYSFYLTDAEGGEIIKYPTDGCTKGEFGENALKYMFVSTGWGAQVNILKIKVEPSQIIFKKTFLPDLFN